MMISHYNTVLDCLHLIKVHKNNDKTIIKIKINVKMSSQKGIWHNKRIGL
jgi:hypothetical protein